MHSDSSTQWSYKTAPMSLGCIRLWPCKQKSKMSAEPTFCGPDPPLTQRDFYRDAPYVKCTSIRPAIWLPFTRVTNQRRYRQQYWHCRRSLSRECLSASIRYLKCHLSGKSEGVLGRVDRDALVDGGDETTSTVVPRLYVSLGTTQHDQVQPDCIEFFQRCLDELDWFLSVMGKN